MEKTILKKKQDLLPEISEIPQEFKPAYEILKEAYESWKKGNIPKTISLLEKSLEKFQELSAYREIANILDFLAELYADKGELDKALKALKGCLDICENFEDEISVAITAEKIVQIYRDKKEYEKMLPYLYRILEIAEKCSDAHRAARAMAGIGDVYRYKKDYQTAKEAYETALKIYKKIRAHEFVKIVEEGIKQIEKEMKGS